MYNSIQNEMAFIGALYKNPIELVNYYRIINPEEFFTEKDNIFLYKCFIGFYDKFLKTSKTIEISEKQFKIYISDNKEKKEYFNKIGGWNLILRFKNISDSDNINVYFEVLKKYALIRELDKKGFPVEKIVKHKKFDTLNADDIIHAYNHNLSKIISKISKEESVIDITQDTVKTIEIYCETPHIGTPFKWQKYTDYLMGMNKGDLMISLGYVNTGKSRKSVSMIADLVFKQNKRVAMIDNEMSAIKTKNCLITTILNDPEYGFNMKIPERNIKLGKYKDEKEKKAVIEIAKFIESKQDLWYFKQLHKFTDEALDLEIRKAVLGLDCEYLFYGTLKGYGKSQGEWATLKTTVTNLKNISGELGIFTHCTGQLTMDSVKLDIFELDETNIGESKGIIQIADFGIIDKEIEGKTLEKIFIENQPLSTEKRWNGSKIIKNRDGGKTIFAQEYNLDYNIWGEYHNIKVGF